MTFILNPVQIKYRPVIYECLIRIGNELMLKISEKLVSLRWVENQLTQDVQAENKRS